MSYTLLEMKMKVCILVLAIALLAGCGQIYTDEIVKISTQCGGVDKINRMWVGLTTTKAYCNNGQRAGDW